MSSQILSKSKVQSLHAFSVDAVRVRLPDGRERSYDLVDHADAVTILPVDDQGRISFVTQFRIGAEKDLLELPAGVMDPGEDPLQSARRELREETGCDCKSLTALGDFYMAPGYSSEYMHCFLAEGLFQAPLKQDEDEFLSNTWLSLEDAWEACWNGVIQDSKTLACLLLAYPKLKDRYK